MLELIMHNLSRAIIGISPSSPSSPARRLLTPTQCSSILSQIDAAISVETLPLRSPAHPLHAREVARHFAPEPDFRKGVVSVSLAPLAVSRVHRCGRDLAATSPVMFLQEATRRIGIDAEAFGLPPGIPPAR